ncbi:hypothetical protein [Embleya sp. NPDC001921]
MTSLDVWLRAVPTPVGIAPGDPLFEAVVVAHDVGESARLTRLGIKAATGRDVFVDFSHFDPRTAKDTAVAVIHWARMYPDSEALVSIGMRELGTGGEESPAAVVYATEDGGRFDFGDFYYGSDYNLRFTDLYGALIGAPGFFTPGGRADLLAVTADQLESRIPEVSPWGAVPLVLHELGHIRVIDALRQGRSTLPNIGPDDREAAGATHWRVPLPLLSRRPLGRDAAGKVRWSATLSAPSRRPVGLDTPQGRWAVREGRRAMSNVVAGAQNQNAHVPPGMTWALDDRVRAGAFRPHAAATKLEAYPDALMTLMMQGEAAGRQVRAMARSQAGSNVDTLLAGAPGLRAAVAELRERTDSETGAPVREKVRVSARTVGAEVARRAPGTVARRDRISPAVEWSGRGSATERHVERARPRHPDVLDSTPVLPQLPPGKKSSSAAADPGTNARLAATSHGFGAAENTQARAASATPTHLPDPGHGTRTHGVERVERDPGGHRFS